MLNGFNQFLVISIFMAGICGAAWLYYQDSQSRLEELTKEKAELLITNNAYEETIANITRENEANIRRTAELNHQLRQAEKYGDELAQKLRRHNLTRLTLQKPGLIETRVNNATKEIFAELESITRSPE
jgi:flagellar biosynthesis/type III secretory pathway chaperone